MTLESRVVSAWSCDGCHRVFSGETASIKVRVRGRTEIVYGMLALEQRIETLYVCRRCYGEFVERRQ